MEERQRQGKLYVYRFSFFLALAFFILGLTLTWQAGISLQAGIFRVLIFVIIGFVLGLVLGNIVLVIGLDVLQREEEEAKRRKAEALAALQRKAEENEVKAEPEAETEEEAE